MVLVDVAGDVVAVVGRVAMAGARAAAVSLSASFLL